MTAIDPGDLDDITPFDKNQHPYHAVSPPTTVSTTLADIKGTSREWDDCPLGYSLGLGNVFEGELIILAGLASGKLLYLLLLIAPLHWNILIGFGNAAYRPIKAWSLLN
jgi:hypothetical protein